MAKLTLNEKGILSTTGVIVSLVVFAACGACDTSSISPKTQASARSEAEAKPAPRSCLTYAGQPMSEIPMRCLAETPEELEALNKTIFAPRVVPGIKRADTRADANPKARGESGKGANKNEGVEDLDKEPTVEQ